jgi:hypothetical protein
MKMTAIPIRREGREKENISFFVSIWVNLIFGTIFKLDRKLPVHAIMPKCAPIRSMPRITTPS